MDGSGEYTVPMAKQVGGDRDCGNADFMVE
jgi:hypothetical protein